MLTREEIEKFDIDPAIRFCFDYILPISDDRVLATLGQEISLITKSGDMICTYDSIQIPMYYSSEFEQDSESLAYVSKDLPVDDYLIIIDNNLYGLIDYDGNIVLEPEYSILRFISDSKMEILK